MKIKTNLFYMLIPMVWLGVYFGKVFQWSALTSLLLVSVLNTKYKLNSFCKKEDTFVYLFFISTLVISYNAIQPLVSLRYVGVLVGLYFIYKTLSVYSINFKHKVFLKYMQYAAVLISIVWVLEIVDVINFGNLFSIKRNASAYGKALSFLSPVVGMLVPFLLHKFCMSSKKEDLAALIVILGAIVISNGRSGIAAAMVGMVFYLIFSKALNRRAKKLLLIAMCCLCIGGGVFYSQVYGMHRINIMGGDFFTLRVYIWQFSLEQFFQHKWLGIGLQNYRYLDSELAGFMHPHNIILQILLETGGVGSITLLLAIGKAVCNLYKKYFMIWRNSSAEQYNFILSIFSSIASFFASSLVFSSIFHAWWLIYILLLVLILQYSLQSLAKGNK